MRPSAATFTVSIAVALTVAALFPAAAAAQSRSPLPELRAGVARVPVLELPPVDLFAARLADEARAARGDVPHYAVVLETRITPWSEGRWDLASRRQARWRLRLRSPGARSLNLAFTKFHLPEGARFTVSSADGSETIGPFTARDNERHGQLWTPPILADELLLELVLSVDRPAELEARFAELGLELGQVQHGYAGFGEPAPRSGPCEHDVVCTVDEGWLEAARSVALVSVEGVRFCTGFLVNDTRFDGRPFFITAHHCGITRENAPSVVVMWSYQSPRCRDDHSEVDEPRPSRIFQSGATLRASYEPTDVTLIELDDPPDPAWNVFYAGWDRSEAEPLGATVIHHPNTDVKRLSIDLDRVSASTYLGTAADGPGDHLRIDAWDVGSTEGGSSGAPLFNEARRVVGQLHGGYAACESPGQADWFGRFSASWTGSGELGGRLSDWLDPLGLAPLAIDGISARDLAREAAALP